jgi:hypothetical protein
MSDAAETPALTADDRAHLEAAGAWKLAGLDLRYEGGPWTAALDRLADRGLLERIEGTPAYFVTWQLTDAGRAALSAHRDDDLPPGAP